MFVIVDQATKRVQTKMRQKVENHAFGLSAPSGSYDGSPTFDIVDFEWPSFSPKMNLVFIIQVPGLTALVKKYIEYCVYQK
jgi:hypothetical protein